MFQTLFLTLDFRWSVNCWAGILGTRLIGPFFFEDAVGLNGARYLEFLQESLEDLIWEADVPLGAFARHWFMQDGAPPHWARAVRDHLDQVRLKRCSAIEFVSMSDHIIYFLFAQVYPQRWIGRGGPVAWPPRSPDLTPLDFFLWGYVKARIYHTRPENPEDLKGRIRAACASVDAAMLQRVQQCGVRRFQQCLTEEGRTFEHIYYE